MTQKQAQQINKYTEQFKQFSELTSKLTPEYVGVAWGIAHQVGLADAISFCKTKIQDSSLMQAYRDSANADNN